MELAKGLLFNGLEMGEKRGCREGGGGGGWRYSHPIFSKLQFNPVNLKTPKLPYSKQNKPTLIF